MDGFINLEINKKDILYDDKVKMTCNNQGAIRIRDMAIKDFTYAIFPIYRRNSGSYVDIQVDEILSRELVFDDEKCQLDFGREYVGRKCVVITRDIPLNLELKKRDIISDGKVKNTWNGQGFVLLKDSYLGNRSYVIFPNGRKETEDKVILSVDEILNKGVHPHNDHTCRVLLSKSRVDDDCLIVLQEG